MSDNQKHPIDEIFREQLFNESIAPRPELWDSIQKGRKKPAAGGMFKTKMWVAASLLGLAALIAYVSWPNAEIAKTNEQNILAENTDQQKVDGEQNQKVEPNANDEKKSANGEFEQVNNDAGLGIPTKTNHEPENETPKSSLPPTLLDSETEDEALAPTDDLTDNTQPETPVIEKEEELEHEAEQEITKQPEAEEVIAAQPQQTAQQQKTAKVRVKPSPFSFDLLLSPDINGKQINDFDPGLESYISARVLSETYPLGWSAMVRANYSVNPAIKLNLGLRYGKIKENVNLSQDHWTQEVQMSWVDGVILDPFNNPIPVRFQQYDTVEINTPFNMQSSNVYTVLDIPLGFSCQMFQYKAFGFGLHGGISFNLRFAGNGYIPNEALNGEQALSGSGTPLNASAGLGYFGGIQFSYRISKNIEAIFEPTYRVSGQKLINDSQGYSLQYQNFSNYIGLRFNL